MQTHTLESYIKQVKRISISAAAQELGITRQTLYNIFKNNPALPKTAKRIESWTLSKIKAKDLTCP